ncbi:ammonia channel protein [Achromatium sp. WMS2]|nr:ammonia channel protein [Achromatium sp. WMS2]
MQLVHYQLLIFWLLASANDIWAADAGTVGAATKIVTQNAIKTADTVWMMVATALVLLMTMPGIALFYSGMVRKKNVINTMANTVVIAAIVSLLWFIYGYSLAFTTGNIWIGGMERMLFAGFDYVQTTGEISINLMAPTIPESVFAMFQLTFAIITAALIVGACVERMRFTAMIWFISLWLLLVYVPIAHWVWSPVGWLAQLGALDFAGGAVVHINAGASGLICAWFLGPRRGYGREAFEPYSLALTMAGTGLLWIGWFGFNAGSALSAGGRAGLAMLVTHIAAASGALTWMMMELVMRERASLLGLCSGVVAGLVAVTPAAGFIAPKSAIIIGCLSGITCYVGATSFKKHIGIDDSLDVFGIHGIAGFMGAIATGLLNDHTISGVNSDVTVQALAAFAVLIYSGLVSLLILSLIQLFMEVRVDESSEQLGLDISEHLERIGA